MTSNKILDAYQDLDRAYFMDGLKKLAHHDAAFSIGHGQTISQPSLVLQMTQALDPGKKTKVLELGTGSGYQTALLALVSKEVYTVERIESLQSQARNRLKGMNLNNIYYKLDDGILGWKSHGPYDRIMVTAAARHLPKTLIDQLKEKGKMVIPVKVKGGQDLLLIEKDDQGKVLKKVLAHVSFVDLIGNY